MTDKSDTKSTKSYLEGLMPDGKLESMVEIEAPLRMGAGLNESMANPEAEMTKRVLQKFEKDEPLSLEESFHVEAIIIPEKRPAVKVINNNFDIKHADWVHLNKGVAKTRIKKAIPACGRIELPSQNRVPYGGTGFFVGKNLIMTNRHVAQQFVWGTGVQELRFIPGQSAAINLVQEEGNSGGHMINVTNIKMVHPYWDMALLEVAETPTEITPLTLIAKPPEELFGNEVVVCGYPAFDPRNNVDVQQQVFGGVYNVKRIQPGLYKPRSKVPSYGHIVDTVTHDASTLGGNSGSAVIHVKSGKIAALHFAGIYKKENYCISAWDLARDDKVVAAGVNFDEGNKIVENPNPYNAKWAEADPQEGISTNVQSSLDAGSNNSNHKVSSSTSASDGKTTRITIPLNIDVSLG